MKVAVAGLWHLGTVTAACCASHGHDVIAYDEDPEQIRSLQQLNFPVDEPGLREMTSAAIDAGRLSFVSEPESLQSCEVLWVCYDTPVDENDIADALDVISRVGHLLTSINSDALIVISSQLPVGSIASLERSFPSFQFVSCPENLRLGKAIEVFTRPDRVVVGARAETNRNFVAALFAPFTNKLEWMSIESAEMTKSAINSFLATSVAFINEIAGICEVVGADAQEVERGLKTDQRIGRQAYLHAGGAFAGGTLARDVSYLLSLGRQRDVPTNLLEGVWSSNAIHKTWVQRKVIECLGDLNGKAIVVFGLTYKAGTNTLRRSSAIETCIWLLTLGARVRAFDPALHQLPDALTKIQLFDDPNSALNGADALILSTPWPQFQRLPWATLLPTMRSPIIIDPGRTIESLLEPSDLADYHGIGTAR